LGTITVQMPAADLSVEERAVVLDLANGHSVVAGWPVARLEERGLLLSVVRGDLAFTDEGAQVEEELRSELDIQIALRRADPAFQKRLRRIREEEQ
jgi:restriction endonuclease Mrr